MKLSHFLFSLLILGVSVSVQAQTGKDDYQRYCAACHGSDGTGKGKLNYIVPMQPPPPDLTDLAKNHDGKFPFDEVVDVIDGRKQIPSHARLVMPFMGVELQKSGQEFSAGSNAEVKRRIDAIAEYVQSLQRE